MKEFGVCCLCVVMAFGLLAIAISIDTINKKNCKRNIAIAVAGLITLVGCALTLKIF